MAGGEEERGEEGRPTRLGGQRDESERRGTGRPASRQKRWENRTTRRDRPGRDKTRHTRVQMQMQIEFRYRSPDLGDMGDAVIGWGAPEPGRRSSAAVQMDGNANRGGSPSRIESPVRRSHCTCRACRCSRSRSRSCSPQSQQQSQACAVVAVSQPTANPTAALPLLGLGGGDRGRGPGSVPLRPRLSCDNYGPSACLHGAPRCCQWRRLPCEPSGSLACRPLSVESAANGRFSWQVWCAFPAKTSPEARQQKFLPPGLPDPATKPTFWIRLSGTRQARPREAEGKKNTLGPKLD